MTAMVLEILLSAVLAIVFLASAVPKLRHPRGFILAVLEYRVLPDGLSRFYARLIPPLECLLALLLLTGTAVRSAAIVLTLLLFSFIVAVSINLVRGRDLDCHCFGRAVKRSIGRGLLLQDSVLVGAAITLAIITGDWVGLEPWSIFRLLGLVPSGSIAPLPGCLALTICLWALLGRSSSYGRRRYGNSGVRK